MSIKCLVHTLRGHWRNKLQPFPWRSLVKKTPNGSTARPAQQWRYQPRACCGEMGRNFSSSMGQLSQVLKIWVGILQLTKKGKDSSEWRNRMWGEKKKNQQQQPISINRFGEFWGLWEILRRAGRAGIWGWKGNWGQVIRNFKCHDTA